MVSERIIYIYMCCAQQCGLCALPYDQEMAHKQKLQMLAKPFLLKHAPLTVKMVAAVILSAHVQQQTVSSHMLSSLRHVFVVCRLGSLQHDLDEDVR